MESAGLSRFKFCKIRHVVGTMLQGTRDKGRLHALRLGGAQVFWSG
jgi:hypothetical protein